MIEVRSKVSGSYQVDYQQDNIVVKHEGKQLFKVDSCEMFELLVEGMNERSNNPGVVRRAHVLRLALELWSKRDKK